MKSILLFTLFLSLALPVLAKKPVTDLSKAMDAVDDNYSVVKNNRKDVSKYPELRANVATMLEKVREAESYAPLKHEDAPDKDARVAAYKKELEKLTVTFQALDSALAAGDQAKVEEILELIKTSKKAAHEEHQDPKFDE